MSSDNDVLYYQVRPVYRRDQRGMMTAAMQSCALTGKTLASAGGGGTGLSTEVVQVLNDYRLSPEQKAQALMELVRSE